MTSEQLFEMLGNTSDDLLQRAELTKTPARRKWLGYAGIAACLVLCASGAAWYINSLRPVLPTPPASGDTTLYPVIEGSFFVGGMGFEGLEFYDISELRTGNPWHPDAELTTLPVFENVYAYQHGADNTPADEERMRALLMETAQIAGMDTQGLEVTRYYDGIGDLSLIEIQDKFASVEEAEEYIRNCRLRELRMENADAMVSVDVQFNTRIQFLPSIRLPEGKSFGYHDTYEQYCISAEYLLSEYLDRFGMEKPVISIEGGDYSFSGEQSHSIYFYDGSGDLTEQILNYNFDSVRFSCDDVRQLWLIDQKHIDRTHKLGDYPILTPEEAEEMFLAGEYLTTVPEEYNADDMTAAKIELIYRTGSREKYYLPYYRIYAEVEPNFVREVDTKTYGAFYIPAIRPEYLSAVETWDEGFN